MLTQNKSKESYRTFWRFLKGQLETAGCNLANWLFRYTTDGERFLYDGISEELTNSVNTLCVVHLNRYFDRHFDESKPRMPIKKRRKIYADVFGVRIDNSSFKPGLIDAESEEKSHQALK